jgi:zinc-binding in reverse transcriptase
VLNSGDRDLVVWQRNYVGLYTVKSAYDFQKIFEGFALGFLHMIWDLATPLKIKLFFWLVLKDKILAKLNMWKRGWRGNILCPFCHTHTEIMSHLFFFCSFSKEFWDIFNLKGFSGFYLHFHSWDDVS